MAPAHGEDAEKQHHGDVTECAGVLLANHDGPRKQKRNFKIEENEQYRNQIIAHVKFHARIFKGLEAAFVRREFFFAGAIRAQQSRQPATQHHRRNTHQQSNADEHQNGEIVFEHQEFQD